jgi:hypothetical protein
VSIHYAGSDVEPELLAAGGEGDSNAAATPVLFSALLRKPGQKEVHKCDEKMMER